MKDIEFVKSQYLKLRESLIKFLSNFDDESYFYQPTDKSNSTAWIVPHISAFEKIMIADKISGYTFAEFITSDDILKYKPGVDGFAFNREQMLGKEEAIALLQRTKEVSVRFLDDLIEESSFAKEVDPQNAVEKYLFNFSHETEHYGQLKYLLGTWKRVTSE
ncbi:MAG: DinB family protein [Candidatus Thorarchaeota archaeon]